ncbi:MAG TPA: isochorismatase family protein [Stellaceae bacterium]|nr:isochorismatase family protein [Stellaceae bacterium]
MYPQDAILIVIDPQAVRLDALGEAVRFGIVNNLQGLAKLARLCVVPIMITTDIDAGLVSPDIAEPCGLAYRHERNTASVADETLFDQLKGLGRRDVIIAGLVGEAALADAALIAMRSGYRVHVVTDALSENAGQISRSGILRMSGAGIRLTSWVSLVAEFAAGMAALPDGFDELRCHLDAYMFSEQSEPAGYAPLDYRPMGGRLGQVA